MLSATPQSPSAEEALQLVRNTAQSQHAGIEKLFQNLLSLQCHDGAQNTLRFEDHTTGFYSVFDGVRYECFVDAEAAQEQYTENVHRASDAISMSHFAEDNIMWYYDTGGETAEDRLEALYNLPHIVQNYGVQHHTDTVKKCVITLQYTDEHLDDFLMYDEFDTIDFDTAIEYLQDVYQTLQRREDGIASWFGYKTMDDVMKEPHLRAVLKDHSYTTIQKVLENQYAKVLDITNGKYRMSIAEWWITAGVPLAQARQFIMRYIFAEYATASKEYDAPLERLLPTISPAENVLDAVYEYRAQYMQHD